MTFDDVLAQVRDWLGTQVEVVLWLSGPGPAEGWLMDSSGRLERIDDPVEGVDQPVHYVRLDSGHGFALERSWLSSARWETVAEKRSLQVQLGAVGMSISKLS